MPRDFTMAQLAYVAYCKSLNWHAPNGTWLPLFESQHVEQIDAWYAAAEAVVAEIASRSRPGCYDHRD